jgi:hypothetical protein
MKGEDTMRYLIVLTALSVVLAAGCGGEEKGKEKPTVAKPSGQ